MVKIIYRADGNMEVNYCNLEATRKKFQQEKAD